MSLNATSALSDTTMPSSVSNAQSSSSIATPFSAPSAGVISSSCRTTGWSGPKSWPDAMGKASWEPICPAAPVMATRTGALLFCFMTGIPDLDGNNWLSGPASYKAASLGVVVCHVSVRFGIRALGERVLAQQAPKLVIAEPQQLRGG